MDSSQSAWADCAQTAGGTLEGDVGTLVTEHLYLVGPVVAEVARDFPGHVERDELWNAGALGLVEAASRFDARHAIPFARFAVARVRGAILDAARSRDRISRRSRRTARDLAHARGALQQRLGRDPSDHELADELNIDLEEVRRVHSAADVATPLRLDHPVTESDGGATWTLAELVSEVVDAHLPEQALLRRELVGTLRTAVSYLPPRLRDLVERYYFQGHHLQDIAESMGVTSARASQLRAEAITALRSYFAEHFAARDLHVDEGSPGAHNREKFLADLQQTSWRSRLDAAGTSLQQSPQS